MPVTNVWHARNLLESPFFQEALDPARDARYPMDLFVGRRDEATRILTAIASSDRSRSAVQGVPGVGKTTLVQYIKEQAAFHHGIISTERWVSVGHAPDTETVLLQVLGAAYEAVLGVGDDGTREMEPMRAARQMLLAFQSQGGGVTLGVAGVASAGFSRSVTHVTGAGAILYHIPQLLRQLGEIAVDHAGFRGILIHLNNLEYLAEPDAKGAAAILRDLRDLGMMTPGYHYVVVGTGEAIRAAVTSQPQLRGVFGVPETVEPLEPAQVVDLLNLRYRHLRLDPEAPVQPLVSEDSLQRLYELFRGDLRGMLRALEQAALRIGALGEAQGAPMDPEDMRAVLRSVYLQDVSALGETLAGHLALIAGRGTNRTFTKAQLKKLWTLSASRVSQVVSDLQQHGFLTPAEQLRGQGGRPGRPAEEYALAGAARLAFDSDGELAADLGTR